MSNVLVTGATGYIGGRLAPRLLAAGHRVVCLARDPQRLAGRAWSDVQNAIAASIRPRRQEVCRPQ